MSEITDTDVCLFKLFMNFGMLHFSASCLPAPRIVTAASFCLGDPTMGLSVSFSSVVRTLRPILFSEIG